MGSGVYLKLRVALIQCKGGHIVKMTGKGLLKRDEGEEVDRPLGSPTCRDLGRVREKRMFREHQWGAGTGRFREE